LKLFGDFHGADAVIEVINNGVHRHPCAPKHRRAALHSGLHFHQPAFRPANFFQGRNKNLTKGTIPCFQPKSQIPVFRPSERGLAWPYATLATAISVRVRMEPGSPGILGTFQLAGAVIICCVWITSTDRDPMLGSPA